MSKAADYKAAKARVEAKLGFYTHAGIYAGVNAILAVVDIAASPEKLWFFYPLAGWGIGLLLHGFLVYQLLHSKKPAPNSPKSKSLKERMIDAEMKRDQEG